MPYFQSDTYFLSGNAGAGVQIPDAGRILLDAQAKAALELATMLWSTPVPVLGGNLGVSLTIPFGYQEVTAALRAVGPGGGVIEASRTDDTFNAGDPVPSVSLGWHHGNWHGTVAGQINVPIGNYDADRFANIGFNRWAGDVTGALTWFNPQNGFEASVAAGFTFNGRNQATDYRTGTEFHLEAAASKTFATASHSTSPAITTSRSATMRGRSSGRAASAARYRRSVRHWPTPSRPAAGKSRRKPATTGNLQSRTG